MATIIDELIISLGWDTSTLEKGHRQAENSLKKVKDRAVKQAKDIEGSNVDVAETFAKIASEAALFFAALEAFKAAEKLIIKVNRTNSALGRFATNVGAAPQTVAAMGFAVERMGGTAQDAQASINAMSKALYDLHTNGKALPAEIYRLQALSGMKIDSEHGLTKFLDDIAAAAQKLSKTDMTQAHFLLSGAGINDATANAMIKYGRGFSEIGKSLAPTKEAIAAAQQLATSFATAQESVKSVGGAVASQLDPPMATLLDELSAWIEDNKQLEASSIVKWLEGVGERLKAIGEFAKARIDEFDAIVNFLKTTPSPAVETYEALKRGPGHATPIPWLEWWRKSEQYIERRAGELATDPFGIGARAEPSGLTVQGQQISRGNPMPVDIVRVGGSGADANSFLGGPIGSDGPPPAGAGGEGAPSGGRTPLAKKYQDAYPHLSSPQCIALARAPARHQGSGLRLAQGDSIKDAGPEPGTPHGRPAGTNNPHRAPLHLPAHPHTLTPLPKTRVLISSISSPSAPLSIRGRSALDLGVPLAGARLSSLAAANPVVTSSSTARHITRLQVRGSSAQEIADNLVVALRAELTA